MTLWCVGECVRACMYKGVRACMCVTVSGAGGGSARAGRRSRIVGCPGNRGHLSPGG